jgi:hypothetical protein
MQVVIQVLSSSLQWFADVRLTNPQPMLAAGRKARVGSRELGLE